MSAGFETKRTVSKHSKMFSGSKLADDDLVRRNMLQQP
jgi:hypothetical protein